MPQKKKKLLVVGINVLLVFVVVIIQYTPLLSMKIGTATPMLSLAAIIAISMFCSELMSSVAGMILGIFTDTSSSTSFGFNSIIFFLVAFATSFFIHYLFNNNFCSAIALGIIFSTLYFVVRWLFFFSFGHNISDSFTYLFQYALPSIIYTTVVTLIFYFFEKMLFKKIIKQTF